MKLQNIFLIFSAALQLIGCQAAKKDPWSTEIRWASLPIAITVDNTITKNNDALQDVTAGVEFWNKKAEKEILKLNLPDPKAKEVITDSHFIGKLERPEKIHQNILFFPEEWSLSSDIAGKTIMIRHSGLYQNAMIVLNKSKNYCYGECTQPEQNISFRRLVAHELGHFIGLSHTDDPQNILYPVILPSGELSSLRIEENVLLRLTR